MAPLECLRGHLRHGRRVENIMHSIGGPWSWKRGFQSVIGRTKRRLLFRVKTLRVLSQTMSRLAVSKASTPNSKGLSAHNHSQCPAVCHQPQSCKLRHSWSHWKLVSLRTCIVTVVRAYLAPPEALLNHEQISCEKQSCVYALPTAVPVQPAPHRPLHE